MTTLQISKERIEALKAGHKVLAEFRYEPRPIERGYAGHPVADGDQVQVIHIIGGG